MVYKGVSINLILAVLRVALGAMIFAHGFNKIFRGGKLAGTASWFESIGMRPGKLNAYMAAGTEVGTGALLTLGLLTSLADAALISLMVVAIVTVHRFNGFFVFNKGQGVEYCSMIAIAALASGTLGAGRYSLDHVLRHQQPFMWLARPSHALLVTAIVGVGGAAAQLAAAYRPPIRQA